MEFKWTAYDGCLEPEAEKRNWMTAVRTQKIGQCVPYGTLAALESMLKIHYYNDPAKAIDLSEDDLINITSAELALKKLEEDGIEIPSGVSYKIKDYCKILGASTVETPPGLFGGSLDVIKEAKKYIRTNGPIIAEYTDPVVGFHCVAIVGYTGDDNSDNDNWICKDSWPLKEDVTPYPNDATTWNEDGTCKISYAEGGYREIGAKDMIENYSGALWAISLLPFNPKWNGVYKVHEKWGGYQGKWHDYGQLEIYSELFVLRVTYNGTPVTDPKCGENTISWSKDPILGNCEIRFRENDDRPYYWPDGPIIDVDCFTGYHQSGSEGPLDFRGKKQE